MSIPFESTVDPTPVSAVYGMPEVAGAGLTEVQCQAQGIDYEVGRSEFDLIPGGAIGRQPLGIFRAWVWDGSF